MPGERAGVNASVRSLVTHNGLWERCHEPSRNVDAVTNDGVLVAQRVAQHAAVHGARGDTDAHGAACAKHGLHMVLDLPRSNDSTTAAVLELLAREAKHDHKGVALVKGKDLGNGACCPPDNGGDGTEGLLQSLCDGGDGAGILAGQCHLDKHGGDGTHLSQPA